MDYKTIFLKTYKSTLLDQENMVKVELQYYYDNKRTYNYASGEVGKILLEDRKKVETSYPFFRYNEHFETFQDKNNIYTEDPLDLILKNEMKDLFDNGKRFGLSDYSSFIKQFALFMGLEDSRKHFGSQNWLNELYYDYNELEKLSLTEVGNIKDHKDYVRLINKKFPSNTRPNEKSKSKSKNTDKDFIYPKFNENERILLGHYLTHDSSLSKVEKAKIIVFMNEPIPSSTSIFEGNTRENDYYNKFRRGYDYFGMTKSEELLRSLLVQVKPFNLTKLNAAIKMDLNKVRNDKINKQNLK